MFYAFLLTNLHHYNLHALIFNVTSFGWIISIHLGLSCLLQYHIQFTATFSRTQLQHKTRPFCTVWHSLHSNTQSLGFLQSKWPNALSSEYKKRASKQAKQASKQTQHKITYNNQVFTVLSTRLWSGLWHYSVW